MVKKQKNIVRDVSETNSFLRTDINQRVSNSK